MSSSSFSEIKKFFEASNCSVCSKQSRHMGKIEHICTHILCKDYLQLVCKSCHEEYHQQKLYSANKKYIKPIADFLEDLYYHVKVQSDKYELIKVIAKSTFTLLPDNYQNQEEIFTLLKELEKDITVNQLKFYNELFESINNVFMAETQSEQITNLKKIKQNITYDCCSQFSIINCPPFEDFEMLFSNKLKDSISRKTITSQMIQNFINQRQKKLSNFKSSQNSQKSQILDKVNEIHQECLKDRKEHCKGNNRGSLSSIEDPCMCDEKSPSCDECIDAFEFYNKKLEQVF
ncbi:hypothetical protein ABPG74_018089 [Tetrahymena malaccensis]